MAKLTTMSGIAGLNRALRQLPTDAKEELQAASVEIAGDVADDARTRAAALGRGWRYLAPTIAVDASSKPGIRLGGARRIPGRKGARQTVGDLLWGTEFGGGARMTTRQFLAHRGKLGYALWPAVTAHSEETGEAYSAALLKALEGMNG